MRSWTEQRWCGTDHTSHVEGQRRSEQGNRTLGGKIGHSINTLLVFLSASPQFFTVECRRGAELGNERNAWKYQCTFICSHHGKNTELSENGHSEKHAGRAGLPPLEGRPAAPLARPGLALSSDLSCSRVRSPLLCHCPELGSLRPAPSG